MEHGVDSVIGLSTISVSIYSSNSILRGEKIDVSIANNPKVSPLKRIFIPNIDFESKFLSSLSFSYFELIREREI